MPWSDAVLRAEKLKVKRPRTLERTGVIYANNLPSRESGQTATDRKEKVDIDEASRRDGECFAALE